MTTWEYAWLYYEHTWHNIGGFAGGTGHVIDGTGAMTRFGENEWAAHVVKLGSLGWELVTKSDYPETRQQGQSFEMTFKRPLEPASGPQPADPAGGPQSEGLPA